MKEMLLVLALLAFAVAAPARFVHAQDAAPQVQPERFSSGDRFLARVRPESLHVHRLPAEDSERVASLFKNDIVQVVGRSLDASWFEVRRIGRLSSLGWVDNTLIDWDFAPETVPLDDFTTGVIGPTPLTSAPAVGVYLEEAPNLRDLPLRVGKRMITVPALIVVPVLGRNADTTWLQINYFGYQGWISRSTIRERAGVDLNRLPVPFGTPPPDTIPVSIVPIELQQAQIDRLRSFINERRGLAAALESFWWRVYRGEIMPCDAPPEITDYPYSEDDMRELPELSRYVPRLGNAVDYLTAARQPFERCGVIAPAVSVDARNSAINARVIFDATLGLLDNLERTIQESH
jgi:hypothetical protein